MRISDLISDVCSSVLLGLLRTPLPQEASLIETRLYKHDRLMVALPKTHALARQRSIAPKQLAGESFVAFSREKVPAAHAPLISACNDAAFSPDITKDERKRCV